MTSQVLYLQCGGVEPPETWFAGHIVSSFFFFFFCEDKFTIENKKTKKDIHQASRNLRMPGTNLKTIKFNNI